MSRPYSIRSWVSVILLALWLPTAVPADVVHPLEPVNLSSPRATLNSFLTLSDAAYQLVRDEYLKTPSDTYLERLADSLARLESMLDLSRIPPAARFDMGRDGVVYLYEVLSRIELPPEAEIPDAAVYADIEDDKEARDKVVSWTIPHTEITLVRVADGAHAGQFLFASSTVVSAREFYEKVRTLPYRRNLPLKNYAEMRPYLSVTGLMISSQTIEALPGWLKHGVHQQAVWKWIVLTLMLVMTVVVVVVIHRIARRGLSDHAASAHLRRLATPLTLLLTPLVIGLAIKQLTLAGWLSWGLSWLAEAIRFYALAWIAWTGSMTIAEMVIASPRIPDQGLNAHLLRLLARTFGIVAVIAIIIYVSSQLGVPLYGVIAGLGVGGIAIALAAQPTLENFIGGLNLFVDRPVRVGDFCRYGEDPTLDWQRVGIVESIGFRSTQIRGIDNSLTTIPNADFSKMHIINFTRRRSILLLTVLGLRYETTDDQLRFVLATLRDMLLAHPRAHDDEPRVRFTGFGEFSLNVEIRVTINTSDRDEFRAIREDILLRVMKIVKNAGTGFAFPSRTVYQARDAGLDTERQQAAESQVRAWCSAHELPFPTFTADYRKKARNTLDYPPEGSPEACE
jgi:MscS family membrane protein